MSDYKNFWNKKKEFKFNLDAFQKADLKDLVDKVVECIDCDWIKVTDQATGEKVDRIVVITSDGRFFFCNSILEETFANFLKEENADALADLNKGIKVKIVKVKSKNGREYYSSELA